MQRPNKSVSNAPDADALRALDAANHWHPFTDGPALAAEGTRIITHADGAYIWDSTGRKILDAMAGLWCVNVGYGRDRIVNRVAAQMRDLPYYNTFFKTAHEPVINLAAEIAKITPGDLNRIFFGLSGSDSNDTVLRMVRTYWALRDQPERQIVISRKNAYHGSSMAGVSLGGMSAMHAQGGVIADIHHIDQPYWFDEGGDMSEADFGRERAGALERAIDMLGENRVAAFIAEPIQGAGGVIIPPETYWPEIARICRERDILLISDEVICGFGRLGEWFGCQHYGVQPDIISMAKGLTSGYLPMGAVAVGSKVAEVIENGGEFYHGYTYSGHPASAAAALENLAILHEESLVDRVRGDIGPYFAERFASLGDHPLVGQARTRGLMGALELVPDKPSRRRFETEGAAGGMCREHCFDAGLMMRAVRDSMICSPPLVISRAEVDELVEKAWKSLDLTARDILS